MDQVKPEAVEQAEKVSKFEVEQAELKLRSLERSGQVESTKIVDSSFTDKKGHPISIRSWEHPDRIFVRAYDTTKGPVPENINLGTAGRADAALERLSGQPTRVRLNWIETDQPAYRGTGISGEMLKEVEQFAKKHGATEIYGTIKDQGARDFFESQVDKGWEIVQGNSYYGEAHYRVKT